MTLTHLDAVGPLDAAALVDEPGDVLALAAGTGVARSVLERLGVDHDLLVAAEGFSGKAGATLRVPLAPGSRRTLLVGTGDGSETDLRRAGAGLGRAVRGRDVVVTTLLAGLPAGPATAAVEGFLLGGWAPAATGTRDRSDGRPAGTARLVGARPDAVRRGAVLAGATALARDLAVTPSNVKNPAWMVERAREAAAAGGLDVDVWDEVRLAAEGFGGLVAVGGGSATPPRLVRLDHVPDGPGARRPPVVLVGKGITYDTGGLSIKPREAMVPMKTDMSGSAAVLAALAACRALGVRRHVVGLLPLAENAFGAASYRPSDVVTHYGGTTSEVANTDAEGRMVLADALAYALTLRPALLVDVATLTGAATLGLGRRHAALYATDDRLAAALETAAAASGERVWRMPLVEDYRPALDSDVADLRHVPSSSAWGGGSITAALFLREFTGGRPWAHLDIAGTARSDAAEHEVPKGATGFGARLLLRWLETLR